MNRLDVHQEEHEKHDHVFPGSLRSKYGMEIKKWNSGDCVTRIIVLLRYPACHAVTRPVNSPPATPCPSSHHLKRVLQLGRTHKSLAAN